MARNLLIATVSMTDVPTPTGVALTFAEWLAEDMNDGDFMAGQGTSYKVFDSQTLQDTVEEYVDDHDLSEAEAAAIWAWLDTLPRTDADTLELFFSW